MVTSFPATESRESGAKYVTALIPDRQHPGGPATRSRLRRTFGWLTVFWLIGLGIDASNLGPSWKAFGLGFFWPGGGLLYAGHPVYAALSFVGFVASIGVLWGLGPVLVPPGVWLGTAALAALAADDSNWEWARVGSPAILVALFVLGITAQQVAFRRSRRRGRRLNESLANVRFAVSAEPQTRTVTEASEDDIASLRYALDLALQPIEKWDGFQIIDQFRESAVRYQLQFLQYGAAMYQYTRTPAFTGYLSHAQRNSIEKMLDPLVWKYWRWENLWGNLRWDPDPVKRDNVMLSGYWATMIGLYESVTGDQRYNETGSLTFRNGPKEVYPYDFPSLAVLMRDNMVGSPFCMFPCEPSWIYPFCNSYALNTVILRERLSGNNDAERVVSAFRTAFDQDFLQPDGRIVGIRNGRFGFNIPSTVTVSDAVLAFWLNPGMPDIAQRIWWVMRQNQVTPGEKDLFPAMRLWDYIDPGNYKIGKDTFSRTAVLLAAREMGDYETADLIQQSVDQNTKVELVNGVRRYEGVSVYCNLQAMFARFTQHNAMREMVTFGVPEEWHTGPVLARADYPAVLVAKAVTDGKALELVLRPGQGAKRTTLGLERLVPGKVYAADGAVQSQFVADPTGRADVDVDLGGRLEITVRPVN